MLIAMSVLLVHTCIRAHTQNRNVFINQFIYETALFEYYE
jgi:hypothetical protein